MCMLKTATANLGSAEEAPDSMKVLVQEHQHYKDNWDIQHSTFAEYALAISLGRDHLT